MRRSIDNLIALQCPTAIVAVTVLWLAQLPAGALRAQAFNHALSWRNIATPARANQWSAAGAGSAWYDLTRLIHHGFSASRRYYGATVDLEPPMQSQVNSRDQ